MKIKDIFDFEKFRVDFAKAEQNEELKKYIDVLNSDNFGYHSKWHREKNVYEHMKLTHDAMIDILKKNIIYNKEEKMVLIMSAFLHDIGKAHTSYKDDKGNYSFPNHDKESNQIVKKLLFDERKELREAICYLCRNHMKIYDVINAPNPMYEIISIANNVTVAKNYSTIRNLLLLKEADCRGSIMEKEDNFMDNINTCKKLAIEGGCLNSVNTTFKPFTVYIMCGLPGSGKSTIAKNLKTESILNRDSLRKQLFKWEGEGTLTSEQEHTITSIINEGFRNCLKNYESCVLDNTNLTKKGRKHYIEEARRYGAKTVIIYVECLEFKSYKERRPYKDFDKLYDIFMQMLEVPSLNEADDVRYIFN